MIAELFQRRHLRANRNYLTEHLHLGSATLDGESSRPRRLETDEQHQIFSVRQALHQVVQYASAGDRTADTQ